MAGTPRIHLQIGSGLHDSHVFVDVTEADGERRRHEIACTGFDAHLDNQDCTTRLSVYMPDALLEIAMPAELVDLIREPLCTILDTTPWYARLWPWFRERVQR